MKKTYYVRHLQRIFFICIGLIMLYLPPLLAQSIKVSVELEDENDVDGISIMIIDTRDEALADFCITVDSSHCIFSDLEEGTYEVKAQYFGYQNSTHLIELSKDSDQVLLFTLKPVAYDLPNVSVIDKIIGMKRRGDTLQYNLKAYTTNNEKTLGDIINQLPGMQIDQEGNVLVRDKKADALLIEGRELVNEQHKLATEGLQSDLIATIELIENYKKEKEQFVGETENDKVAVNVRLKEEVKGLVSGNAQLYAGLPNFIRSAVNLFRTSDKSGYSLYLRQNNIGEKSFEKPLYLALEEMSGSGEGWKKLMRLESVPVNQIFQSGSGIPNGLVENEDYHFALNGDHDLSKRITNRLYVTGSLAKRKSESNVDRTYFDRDVTEQFESRIAQMFPALFMRNETVVKWNPQHFTELILPLHWTDAKNTEIESGIFNQIDFQQQNLQRRRSLSLHPYLEHSYKMKNGLLMTLSQDVSFGDNQNDIELNSLNPIFGLPNVDSLNEFQVGQEFLYRKLQSKTGIEFRKNWGKSYLLWKGQFDSSRERISADANQQLSESIEGTVKLESNNIQHSLQGRKDFGSGRITITLNHAWLQQEMLQGSERSGHHFLPYALFVYEYARTHAFSVSYSQAMDFPNLLNTYTFSQVLGPRILSTGDLDLEVLRRTTAYSLSLFAPPLSGSSLLYNVGFSYNQINKSFIRNSVVKQDYVLNEYIETPPIDQFSLRLYISRFFDRWSFILQSRTSFEDGFASRATILEPLQFWQSNNSFLIRSKRWGNWSISSKLQHRYLRQTLSPITREFHNWNINFQAKYSTKNWAIDTEVIYNAQAGNQLNNNLWVINAEIQYSQTGKWRYFLQGNNILNLQSTDVIEAGFQANYSEILMFPTFPGQVLIGIGYYF